MGSGSEKGCRLAHRCGAAEVALEIDGEWPLGRAPARTAGAPSKQTAGV